MQSAMKTPTPSENERSYSMETIYKPSQGLRSSEIFDTTYNIGIRQGPSIFKPVHWENRKNLITTGLCTSIGVACLWRFPTYCYRFGGGK
ncbi:hypothetical protein C0J52_14308 [Blattella germanica]|nr:hypothetical protein C0J52_14308 [Blattella germanica]